MYIHTCTAKVGFIYNMKTQATSFAAFVATYLTGWIVSVVQKLIYCSINIQTKLLAEVHHCSSFLGSQSLEKSSLDIPFVQPVAMLTMSAGLHYDVIVWLTRDWPEIGSRLINLLTVSRKYLIF